MIGRRDLLTSSMAAGLMSLTDVAPAGAAHAEAVEPMDGGGGQLTTRDVDTLAKSITDIRDELRFERTFSELVSIRAAQKQHLLSYGKFPDFVDVGIDIWFEIYDWHVRWQQPVAMGRDPQNRRTILLFETQIVLRLDLLPRYQGQPYDKQ